MARARVRNGGVVDGAGGIGLSLAGGGPAGAIYEIGALWALQESLDGLDLAALRCYVGVSAGALLAACLANGMSADLLARIIHGEAADEEPFEPEIFFAPNYREFLRRGVSLPRFLARAVWYFTGKRQDRSVLASLSHATRALPLGIFANEPIRRHLTHVFARAGRTDEFRELRSSLTIVASDLETGRAVRFGRDENAHVPISRAVQASTALPGIYPPVRIDGRVCVDGVLLKTLHASVALDQGVGLLICVNPIVPVDTTAVEGRGERPPGTVLAHGLPAVLSQTFRTLVHSRLEVGLASYADRYPDADVVLFEPARDAYDMFFANLFSLDARREIFALAYRATRDDLRRRAPELEPVFARHGVSLRRDVLNDLDRDAWEGVVAAAG
ncbi:MAG TPA: patatin-like phospholipase family protein [Gaiellaceae bacterium]|nr:patatin-like phospholipase family protein [Gaiellaceae bacterium]